MKEYNVILHLCSVRKTVKANNEDEAIQIAMDGFEVLNAPLQVEFAEIDDYEEYEPGSIEDYKKSIPLDEFKEIYKLNGTYTKQIAIDLDYAFNNDELEVQVERIMVPQELEGFFLNTKHKAISIFDGHIIFEVTASDFNAVDNDIDILSK